MEDVVMRPKFDNSRNSMREVIVSFFLHLTQKNTFFEGWSWFKFNNLGLALGIALEFYTGLGKGLKLKVRKLWGSNSYVRRSYRWKTGRGAWRRLKISIVDFEQVKFWIELSAYKVKWLYQNKTNSFLSALRNHFLLPYYTLIAKIHEFWSKNWK